MKRIYRMIELTGEHLMNNGEWAIEKCSFYTDKEDRAVGANAFVANVDALIDARYYTVTKEISFIDWLLGR